MVRVILPVFQNGEKPMTENNNSGATVETQTSNPSPSEGIAEVVSTPQKSDKEIFADARAERQGKTPKPEIKEVDKADKTAKPVDKPVVDKQQDPLPKKKQSKYEQKLGELHRKNAKLQEELAKAKATPKPVRDQAKSDEDYIAELAQHKTKETILETELARSSAEAESTYNESWSERVLSEAKDVNSFVVNYNKFSADIVDNDPNIAEYIMKSDVGITMLEEIMSKATNPNWLASYKQLPKVKKYRLLDDLENFCKGQGVASAQPVQNTVSNAPTPVKPMRANEVVGGTSHKDYFTQARNERLAKFRG